MTAVVGSTLVGMVTGVPGANVAITGNFTIPLMKKSGYSPEQAGAIEASASTGGQFMPPVMGAAVFIMAGLTGIPYFQICMAALIPAFLYYLSVGAYCHFQANKLNIAPLAMTLDRRELLSTSPSFTVPLIVIIVLFMRGYTPMYVAFWAVVSTFILTVIIKPRPSVRQLLDGFSQGARVGATIGVTCAAIGVVVRVVELTGLGVKLGSIVATFSGGIPVIALILTAATALVLGTGIPTAPAYILVGMVVAPVLVGMGYTLMQAHLFVLYFAVMSMLTPPVAPGAIVASSLAGASFMRTAIECVKSPVAGWIVPFVFMWAPFVILQPSEASPLMIVLSFIALAMAILSASAGFVNYYLLPCTLTERALCLIIPLLMLVGMYSGSYILLALTIALFVLLTIKQWRRKNMVTIGSQVV